jgi:hypothetical protein
MPIPLDLPPVENCQIDESHINSRFVWMVAFIAAMGGLLYPAQRQEAMSIKSCSHSQ